MTLGKLDGARAASLTWAPEHPDGEHVPQLAMVLGNTNEGGGCFRMTLVAPRVAATARPGQFIHIRCGDTAFLRRPISIADADADGGTITLLIRRVGAGTDWLANRRSGEHLDIIGPLGNGFTADPAGEWWLIAGGIGWAPLRFLARQGAALGKPVRVFYGARTVNELIGLEDLDPEIAEFSYATDNGSHGVRGTAIDILPADADLSDVAVFACGPKAMLRAVSQRLADAAPVYLSLEERMACGVGACLGCAVAVPDGLPKRVCADGPVFLAHEVIL